MLFKPLIVALLSLFGSVIAQSETVSDGSTSTDTSSAPAATKTFSVGAEGKTFTPHEHVAKVGDIIEYRFYPLNHSVVKADFGAEPCIPYELTGAGRVGWWSGWKPINVVTSNPPIFRIRINDTEPLFFYCSAPGSCQHGMIGVVNPNSTQTYEAQFAYTENATASLSPGEFFPEEKLDPSPTAKADTSKGENDKTAKLSGGAIAGIAIGGVVVLAMAALLMYMFGRHKSFKDLLKNSSNNNNNANKDTISYQPASPGLSEAHYSNMAKSPVMTDARFSSMTYGNESYRSASPPPLDERGNAMVGVMMNGQQGPGVSTPGWPSPSPRYEPMHEMDPNASVARPTSTAPPFHEVHELAAASGSPTNTTRSPRSPAFSFTNNEAGYVGGYDNSKPGPNS